MTDESPNSPLTQQLPVQGARWGPDSVRLSGLERMRGLLEGTLPDPPCTRLSGMRLTEIGPGLCTVSMPASPWWQSATGTFPGGTLAFAADSSLGAVLTSAPSGIAASTSDLSVNFLRPASPRSDRIIARSRLVHAGRSVGLAAVSVEDGRGRTLAHGTSRSVLFPVDADMIAVEPEPLSGADGPAPHETPWEGEIFGQDFFNSHSGLEAIPKLKTQPMMRFLGLHLDAFAEGRSTMRMLASPWLTNQAGFVYGGAIAVLADVASSFAVMSVLPAGTSFGPLDLKISFLRPTSPDDGDLVANASIAHRGRTILILHCEVVNAAGKRVAMTAESFLVLPGRPWEKSLSVADEMSAVTGEGS